MPLSQQAQRPLCKPCTHSLEDWPHLQVAEIESWRLCGFNHRISPILDGGSRANSKRSRGMVVSWIGSGRRYTLVLAISSPEFSDLNPESFVPQNPVDLSPQRLCTIC